MAGRGFPEIAQGDFQSLPLRPRERLLLRLLRYHNEVLQKLFNPPMAVAQQAQRIGEAAVRLGSHDNTHSHPVSTLLRALSALSGG